MRNAFGHEIAGQALNGPNGRKLQPVEPGIPTFKSDAELLRTAKAEASVMRETIATQQMENAGLKKALAESSASYHSRLSDIADLKARLDAAAAENVTLKESVANLSQREPLPAADPAPVHETVNYADGSSATGPGPLPQVSPEGAPAVPAAE